MDIGIRLKLARQKANLTQIEAAESLNVSRQTISNWETGKTYPELSAVVKMSEIYNLTLDELLKENTDYIRYINNSTEKKTYKFRPSILIEIIAFFLIWGLILAGFYIKPPHDTLSYVLKLYVVVFPVFIFLFSVTAGADSYWGRFKWILMPIFAYSGCFMDFCTFNTKSLITNGDVYLGFTFEFMPFFAISFIGIVIGIILRGTFKKLVLRFKNGT